ncbi:TPA: hypothetical protein DIV48_03555 [Candidatus Kaiserbacteria bacterium]|nr:hypothetical protein [Candidatus Kaiserbacteria bacterium]
MDGFAKTLRDFIVQANSTELKTAIYPRTLADFRMQVSFGMGSPARVPWIAFTTPEMKVSKGFYPVYLYYKDRQTLILAYGVSETEAYAEAWPVEIQNEANTIEAFFGEKVPRYGDSFVFKVYQLQFAKHSDSFAIVYAKSGELAGDKELESDLQTLLEYYGKVASLKIRDEKSPTSQGLFYMEKQLEDFLIHNWDNTELGKRFDLIVEDGELMSQQYKTDIGPIDILAKDKKTGSHVVIELKRNQTSDDTVGQATRYMGWIKANKGDDNVKAVIVAGSYDKRLDYALRMVPNIEVFLYEISFKLKDFSQ